MEKYRIDNAYGKVYEWDRSSGAYVFCGSFYAFGITSHMSEAEQLRVIENA